MKIPRGQIVPVLADLAQKSGVSTERLSREVAAYLLGENRTGELDSLLRDVVAYRAERGIVEVTAISAHELSDATKRDIEKLVRERFENAKDIIINQRVDANTIGGVRLELVGEQLDLTVRAKLNRFKELTTTGERV
jgi:F0F1-type ATP synthase delta subunit